MGGQAGWHCGVCGGVCVCVCVVGVGGLLGGGIDKALYKARLPK